MWYNVVATVGIGRADIVVTRTNSGQEFKQDSKAASSAKYNLPYRLIGQ